MKRGSAALARLLRAAARLLAPAQREWAEAVAAEAHEVPAGWPRLRWLMGGLWLIVREAGMVRKIGYAAGMAAVATAAAWAMWRSWQVPASTPGGVTDRSRILVGVAALVVLPWLGRRRGVFGPVGGSIPARLVRVAGCATMCGLALIFVQMFSSPNAHTGAGRFSWPAEISGLALLAAALAAPLIVPARWPQADASYLWGFTAIAAVLAFIAIPLQVLTVAYLAGILAATSRRSRVTPASLGAGVSSGMAAGLIIRGILTLHWNWNLFAILALAALLTAVLACVAGLWAAWLRAGAGNPPESRAARIRQGVLAGAVAGAASGLLLTAWLPILVVMMVLGPLAGLAAGTVGAAIAADHPRKPRQGSSRYAGLFVLKS